MKNKKLCRRRVCSVLLALISAGLIIQDIRSALTGVSGELVLIGAPVSVQEAATESDVQAVIFAESGFNILSEALPVDISEPGLYDDGFDLNFGVIPAGRVVNSYLLHADPENPQQTYSGSVTFDTDVLGIFVRDASLRATDGGFGAPFTAYPPPPGLASTGLEFDTDSVTLSLDRKTVSFSVTVGDFVDQIRILTDVRATDVKVEKTATGPAPVGGFAVFEVQITNQGANSAGNVVATDPVPAGLTFVSNDGACKQSYPCIFGFIAVGDSKTITSTYAVPFDYSGASPIENTVTVTTGNPDTDSSNNSATASAAVQDEADLSISKTAPILAIAGSEIQYEITALNSGPAWAQEVVVDDPTPPGLELVSLEGACAGSFPCQLGSMGPFQSRTVTVTYSVASDYDITSLIVNTASVSSSVPEGASGNESATTETAVEAHSDLAIKKNGPTQALRGDEISYTLNVTNNGPSLARNVSVSDSTPQGLIFLANSADCQTAFPCDLGDLDAGETRTITSSFLVPLGYSGPTTMTNTSEVSSDSTEVDATDNTATALTSLTLEADLGVVQSLSSAQVEYGDVVTIAVEASNQGPDSARDSRTTTNLPAGFEIVRAVVGGRDCQVTSGSVTCSGGTVRAGGSFSSLIRVVAKAAGSFEFVSHATTSSVDSESSNNFDRDPLEVDDGDGVPPEVENAAPFLGDGNFDGTPDSLQPDVASLPSGSPGVYLTMITGDPTRFRRVRSSVIPAPGDAPDQFGYPFFFFQYDVVDLDPGTGVIVRYLLQQSSTVHGLLKGSTGEGGPILDLVNHLNYGPTSDDPDSHWYEFLFDGQSGVEIGTDSLELFLLDGARGDDDQEENGVISLSGTPVRESSGEDGPRGFFYIPQFVNGRSAGEDFVTKVILANTGAPTVVGLEFFDSNGSPMVVDIPDLGESASFLVELGRGQSSFLEPRLSDELRVGYVRLLKTPGVGGLGVIGRSISDSGIVLYETGVPAVLPEADITIALDSLGEKDTGLALVRPFEESAAQASRQGTGTADFTMRVYNEAVELVATTTFELAPGQHLARYVHEFLKDSTAEVVELSRELRGSVTLESSTPLAAATLQLNDNLALTFPDDVGTLATFPVALGRFERPSDTSSDAVVYFPRVGSGLDGDMEFETTLVLINSGSAQAARLEFFDLAGQPLPVSLGGLGVKSLFDLNLAAGRSLFAMSEGMPELLLGYARVTASTDVSATAIYSRREPISGIALFEAGIPASTAGEQFSVVVDSLGEGDTGLGLVNAASAKVDVTLRLYDTDFQLIGTQIVALEAAENIVRFVWEFFQDESIVARAREMQGVVTIEATGPVAVVTLRQNGTPSLSFPDTVPVLTAFPAFTSRADEPQEP